MEKRAVIQKGLTPDTENVLLKEKRASDQAKTEALDDDFTKQAAETATESLK